MRVTRLSLAALVLVIAAQGCSDDLSPVQQLGKRLLFDTNLSTPPGQSCAACHAPQVGFTGPNSVLDSAAAVYPGAVSTRFGNRKPPTVAYAGGSPVLHYDKDDRAWVGGMFWDGRATGRTLGDPLAEQAMGPFLNELEQNNATAKVVCEKVGSSDYAPLFRLVWGSNSLDPVKDADRVYERIARSIAAYERSREVNPFTSKYDYYLKGKVNLTKQEAAGLTLFQGKAKCDNCHTSKAGSAGKPPLFTDFTYDNLGIPKNPANPFYAMPRQWNPDGKDWVDPGLGGYLASAGHPAEVSKRELGKHKVPTLRNVDLRPSADFVKAYGHNGYFKSLEDIVHFYNTRDVKTWPAPEVSVNINTQELGNLRLTSEEEAAVVAFLKTLSDGYVLPSAQTR